MYYISYYRDSFLRRRCWRDNVTLFAACRLHYLKLAAQLTYALLLRIISLLIYVALFVISFSNIARLSSRRACCCAWCAAAGLRLCAQRRQPVADRGVAARAATVPRQCGSSAANAGTRARVAAFSTAYAVCRAACVYGRGSAALIPDVLPW